MILKNYLYIRKEKFTLPVMQKLTIKNPAYTKQVRMGIKNVTAEPEIILYKRMRRKDGSIWYKIPRYTFGKLPTEAKDKRNDVPVSFSFKHENLDNEQKTAVEEAFSVITSEGSASLIAKPGSGKTIAGIAIASMLKQKTLVLVHKNFLVKQWTDRILSWTDLRPEDIGTLKQGKFRDGKIVIGTLQSLYSDTISKEVNDLFGFIIVDEMHTAPTNQFIKAFTRFNRKYSLGLTATPERDDGLEHIFYLHISYNQVLLDSKRNVQALVKMVNYPYTKKVYLPTWLPPTTAIKNALAKDRERNLFILRHIGHYGERKCIVLSDRIEQLENLMQLMRENFPKTKIIRMFGNRQLTREEKKKGVKLPKYKDPSLEELSAADVVFATFSKAKEGLDLPDLSVLIFATPISSKTAVPQTVGRIQRKAEEGKKPVVIDIVDSSIGMLKGMARKRSGLYEELNCKVKFC